MYPASLTGAAKECDRFEHDAHTQRCPTPSVYFGRLYAGDVYGGD